MGSLQATEMANSGLDIEQSLSWHLTANHYPPVPNYMVAVCVEVVEWINNGGDLNQRFALPNGSTWRGESSAPAWAIVEGHHLDAWLVDGEEF
jgi:hypothetical protein